MTNTYAAEVEIDHRFLDQIVDRIISQDWVTGAERNGDVIVIECDTDYYYEDDDYEAEHSEYPYLDSTYMVTLARLEQVVAQVVGRDLDEDFRAPVREDILMALKFDQPSRLDSEDVLLLTKAAMLGSAAYGIDY